jgi:hypothetical protein
MTRRSYHMYICRVDESVLGVSRDRLIEALTDLFPKAPQKANSRDHHYTRWRTFWCMLWQSLNPNASGREVVRQLQALLKLEGGPELSEEDEAALAWRG